MIIVRTVINGRVIPYETRFSYGVGTMTIDAYTDLHPSFRTEEGTIIEYESMVKEWVSISTRIIEHGKEDRNYDVGRFMIKSVTMLPFDGKNAMARMELSSYSDAYDPMENL